MAHSTFTAKFVLYEWGGTTVRDSLEWDVTQDIEKLGRVPDDNTPECLELLKSKFAPEYVDRPTDRKFSISVVEAKDQEFTRVGSFNLTHFALDWAVAKANGMEAVKALDVNKFKRFGFHPSSNHEAGGPILDEHGIGTVRVADTEVVAEGSTRKWVATPGKTWEAVIGLYELGRQSDIGFCAAADGDLVFTAKGDTRLEAGLRCYVASRLGLFVDVPTQLFLARPAPAPQKDVTAKQLLVNRSVWDDHETYSSDDWIEEVENGDTRESYWEWVASQISQEEPDEDNGSDTTENKTAQDRPRD